MELLIQHITLSLVLSALVSVAIETVKVRLQKLNIVLKGNTWFILSIAISVAVAYAYAMYYNQLPVGEAVMIYFIMVFGAQGFHDVLLDRDKGGDK